MEITVEEFPTTFDEMNALFWNQVGPGGGETEVTINGEPVWRFVAFAGANGRGKKRKRFWLTAYLYQRDGEWQLLGPEPAHRRGGRDDIQVWLLTKTDGDVQLPPRTIGYWHE